MVDQHSVYRIVSNGVVRKEQVTMYIAIFVCNAEQIRNLVDSALNKYILLKIVEKLLTIWLTRNSIPRIQL